MKKIFLSLFCLLGFATFAMADHAQKLTVTVPAQTEACYAIGTFNDWKLEDIIPMDLESSTTDNRVFSCTIMVPDVLPDDKEQQKFKFLAGGQDWTYQQDDGDFYYKDGYDCTVSKWKDKCASHGNIVRFVCSATTEKVYLAGKFAGDSDWKKDKMIRMVEVEKTETTKTFQARVGTNESNMEFKYMPWGREWENQTTDSNNKFNDMPKDASGAAVNEYITVNITAPEGTKEVYLMGHWGGQGTDANRAHKCVKTGDNTFVGIIPSTEANREFRCYNKKDTENYEVDNSDQQVTRNTNQASDKVMNITVAKWRHADAFTQYYVTGTSNLGHDEGKGDNWNEKQLKMSASGTLTLHNLAVGNYEMKVTNGTWKSNGGVELDYNSLDKDNSSQHITKGKDNTNICFYLTAVGDVNISVVDDEKVIITGSTIGEKTIQYTYIAGADNLAAEGGWEPNRYQLENGSKTINLPAGEHQMKITDGTWNHELNFDNIDTDNSSPYLYTKGSGNIWFYLSQQGNVTISVVNNAKIVVTGDIVKIAPYTLEGNGSVDATKTWCHGKWWDINASQMYDKTITFNNVPIGDWVCKVTDIHRSFEWGYSHVNLGESSSLVKDQGDNGIRIELPYVADITVSVVAPEAEKKIVVYVSPAQLDETVDNTTLINDIHDKTVDAQLLREFDADGYWYTLCLPFDLTAEQIATSIGGCQLMKLNSSYMKTAETLYLDFKEETTIEAGVPYLFMPNDNVENPIFKAVQINKDASRTVSTDKASMTGFYQPTVVDPANYFLGENNYLMKNSDASASKAFRAYFTLDESLPAQVMARVVFGQGTPTTMDKVKASKSNRLIMYNGHIFIEKEGVRYTLIGQRL